MHYSINKLLTIILSLYSCLSLADDKTLLPEELEQQYQTANSAQRVELSSKLIEYYYYNNPEKAIELGFNALNETESNPDVALQLNISFWLAMSLFDVGRMDDAEPIALRSHVTALANGNSREQGKSFLLVSIFEAFKHRNYPQAIQIAEQSAQLLKEADASDFYGETISATGFYYYLMGDYEKALEYYQQALNVESFSQHIGAASTYSNIATLHSEFGRYELAVTYNLKALEVVRTFGYQDPILYHTIAVAIAHMFNREFEKAEKFLLEADALQKQIGGLQHAFDIAVRLAEVYSIHYRNFELAEHYYFKALKISDQLDSIDNKILVYNAIGQSKANQKKYHDAIKYTSIGLELAEKGNRSGLAEESHQDLANYYDKSNQRELAFEHLQALLKYNKEKYDKNQTDKIAQLEEEYQAKQKEIEIVNLKQQQEIEQLESQQLLSKIAIVALLVVFTFLGIFYWQRSRVRLAGEQVRNSKEILLKKNQMLSEVSHELGTPLAVLKLQVESLKDLEENDLIGAYDRLDDRINQIERLISDIHQLAQLDADALSLNMELLDVNSLVKSWQEQLENLVKLADFVFQSNLEIPQGCRIKADPQRLNQVLLNLVSNSIRYTDKPGTISFSCFVKNDRLNIQIEDSPPGLSQDQFQRMFDRLYRAESSRNRETGGSGLGLAISLSIIQKLNGEIGAGPSKLGGVKLNVTLPVI